MFSHSLRLLIFFLFPFSFLARNDDGDTPILIKKCNRWVSKLEARLAEDPKAQALAGAAHAAYDACRWALLSSDHVEEVSQRGWMKALRGVGIAGIRDTSKVTLSLSINLGTLIFINGSPLGIILFKSMFHGLRYFNLPFPVALSLVSVVGTPC